MYKSLKTYIPDTRDPEVQKKELIEYFQQEFFDSDNVYSISKAMQDKGITAEKYAIYRQCVELNASDIKKSLANKAGTFKNDYSKMTYILAILKRHSEGSKPVKPPQKEPPAVPPPPKPKEKPSWIDELTADSQPPKVEEPERKLTYAQQQNLKNFPNGDIPVITETDLFEVDPDLEAIHEAWLKLSEEERRKNWEKAIAEHRQQHPPKVFTCDEMY